MTNASEENRQSGTDTRTVETSPIISRRPRWAEVVNIGPETIDYTWTAPTSPVCIERQGEFSVVPVELTREDALYVNDEGVGLDQGPERIFLLDESFDVDNARKLAAAILECCDRIEGAE